MSFALSTVLIIILLLPGAAIIHAYYTSVKSKKADVHISVNDLLLKGLGFSFIVHSIAIWLLLKLGFSPRFNLLYNIILGNQIELIDRKFTDSFLEFFNYNIIVTFIFWILVKLFRRLVYKYKLDLKFYSLKNTNYWFHIFSARYLEGPGIKGNIDDADFIVVDVLIERDIIYTGFLHDFNYSPHKDQLENIVLTNTQKRLFHPPNEGGKPECKTGDLKLINGNVFIIPSEKISNINLSYIKVRKPSDEVLPTICENN